MEDVKSRGVKKGESPGWKVGRKKKEEKIKYISKSVALMAEDWERLENKAKEMGLTKNKLVSKLVLDFLNKE